MGMEEGESAGSIFTSGRRDFDMSAVKEAKVQVAVAHLFACREACCERLFSAERDPSRPAVATVADITLYDWATGQLRERFPHFVGLGLNGESWSKLQLSSRALLSLCDAWLLHVETLTKQWARSG